MKEIVLIRHLVDVENQMMFICPLFDIDFFIDFDTTKDGFADKIRASRAFLILSHLVAIPLIGAFLATLFVQQKIVPIIALVLSAVYS